MTILKVKERLLHLKDHTMARHRSLFFFWLALILLSSQAGGASATHLLGMRGGALAVFQNGVGNSFSGHLAWTPTVDIGLLGVRGELGVTLLKNTFGDKFLAFNYEGFLQFPVFPLVRCELGGGLKTWTNNGGTAVAIGGNLVFPTRGFFDLLYVGYSRFFLGDGVNEVRAGVGFHL